MQMLGYDISWAAFNVCGEDECPLLFSLTLFYLHFLFHHQIVEVMSSKKFAHKRIGYLAACQAFNKNTDVLMLTTNLIKKDLASQNLLVLSALLPLSFC